MKLFEHFVAIVDYFFELGLLVQVLLVEMVLSGALDDLVIHVRDVHHVEDVIFEVIRQHPTEDVEGKVRSGVRNPIKLSHNRVF